jgi:hypothetical protein
MKFWDAFDEVLDKLFGEEEAIKNPNVFVYVTVPKKSQQT